jgi:poly-gamma-glutamate synthesis protein (capsule biosynthesis protein)
MKILIAGDYCPQNRVLKLIERGTFEEVFKEIEPIATGADYSIVNLECPVSKGVEQPIAKQGPNLRCPGKGVEAMKWAGFNCATLANNHFRDFGDEGIKNTLEACREYGIDTVGGGINKNDASQILFKSIQGKTLAIINCCEHEFSIATDSQAGANPLNPIQQYYSIQEAKKQADYVLLIVHGGHEHYQLPSPRMVETYRFFIDAGADAVVNHHQHCFSGYEIYNNKPIFYGLGNFCFDGNRSLREIWHEGYMVMLSFGESVKYEIIPYRQCAEKASIELLEKDAYTDRIEALNRIIGSKERLKQETESYYASTAKGYSNIFEPCNNRYYLGAKERGWLPSFISKKRKLSAANKVLCESHRDKLAYWFNNDL